MKNKRPMTALKDMRKAKGLTQKDLAERTGIEWRALSSYERGVRSPDIETLYNISVVLECSIDALVRDLF